MTISSTPIDGLLVIEPRVFSDDRGYFFEPYNEQRFQEATGLALNFVQDNESMSDAYTVRGLHFQEPPAPQGKLVRVSSGSALDVAVDLRRDSATFGQYHMVLLSAERKNQFWIPEGFAHGFLTLEDRTIFSYKCTGYYAPECERTLRWDDPDLDIDWGVENPIISPKDAEAGLWKDYESPF